MFLFGFFCILVVLIIAHEFGHFLIAKAFGIKVEEFGIFFPPRLGAVRLGETEYSLNALPFGGFVRIFGESSSEETPETVWDRRSFRHKPRYIQAAVIVAGVVFNFLFAWLLLSAGYMVGLPTSVEHQGVGMVRNPQTTVVAVLPGSPAQAAGLQADDVVVVVESSTAALPSGADAAEVQSFIAAHQDQSLIFEVSRGGSTKEFLAKPTTGLVPDRKVVGIELDDVGILQLPLPLALVEGGVLGWQMLSATAEGLGGFFWSVLQGVGNFSNVAGPIGIASIGSAAVAAGFATTITLTALISINLGLINLIPIPGLDGGRLLFIVIEAVIRRPLSSRLTVALTVAGFALIIGLMLLVSYHDIAHFSQPA